MKMIDQNINFKEYNEAKKLEDADSEEKKIINQIISEEILNEF